MIITCDHSDASWLSVVYSGQCLSRIGWSSYVRAIVSYMSTRLYLSHELAVDRKQQEGDPRRYAFMSSPSL